MSGKLEEKCPYCSVLNETKVTSIGHRAWASFIGLFGLNVSESTTVRSLKINCSFCGRKYTLLKFEDLDWVRDRLIWDDSVRTGMIAIFGSGISRDNILSDITGIALRSDGTIDICFKKNGKRAYMSCIKESKQYKGVYMGEINFG